MICRQFFALLLCLTLLTACRQEKKYSNIVYPEGRYPYPNHVEEKSKDFPFYPLRDSMSVLDSSSAVWFGRITLPAYKEPNISLAPMGEEIFRFVAAAAQGSRIIITLKQHEITVKTNGEYPYTSPFPEVDTTKLNQLEKFHYDILMRWFPIPEKRSLETKPWRLHYLDSMTAVYPELLSTAYYFELSEKMLVPKKEKFVYTEEHISITKKQFNDWVALLNKSGYWQLPFTKECHFGHADGILYIMEASTKEKYNCVEWNSCPGDTSNFYKVCDSLAKLAHLEKHVQVFWAE
jgi:hypothetical protein